MITEDRPTTMDELSLCDNVSASSDSLISTDPGSYSSPTDQKDKERDDFAAELTRRENRAVCVSRTLVIVGLLSAAACLAAVAYVVTANEEYEDFETAVRTMLELQRSSIG